MEPDQPPGAFSDVALRGYRATLSRLREESPFALLDAALDECDEAICAYQAGLLDDEELRRVLFDLPAPRRL
ncbi:MAG TPA: hypothetical protein VIH82_08455 [Acidimicrobiia bacterium]